MLVAATMLGNPFTANSPLWIWPHLFMLLGSVSDDHFATGQVPYSAVLETE